MSLASVPTPSRRATACLVLAAASLSLLGVGLLLGFAGKTFLAHVVGPCAQLAAVASALLSVYCGLVSRYLVGRTERRALIGFLLSGAVLAYCSLGLLDLLRDLLALL
jgi:hypothetical protein